MELHQLRYFCAVARAGSFTRAADDEAITQPSLSDAIRKLEARLGVPLFERLGRSIRLTTFGERLLPRAEQILREVAEARSSVEAARQQPSGRLVVGCIPTILPYLFASRLDEFRQRHQAIDLRFVEEITPRLVDHLQHARLDVAIVALPVRNPDLLCGELFREPLLAALRSGHPIASRGSVPIAELAQEPILLLKEGHCLRDDALGLCRRARMQADSRFESDHLAAILPLVAAGFGVSIVPAMAARADGCAFVPLQPPAERRIGYLRLRTHVASQAQKAFVAWLRDLVRDEGPRRSEGADRSAEG